MRGVGEEGSEGEVESVEVCVRGLGHFSSLYSLCTGRLNKGEVEYNINECKSQINIV